MTGDIPVEEVPWVDTRTYIEIALLGDLPATREAVNDFIAARVPANATMNEKLNTLGFLTQDWADFNNNVPVDVIVERYRFKPL